MSSSKLYSELEMLNFIIAMSFEKKSAGIDNIFYQEGYRIVSIDRSINTDIGTIKYDIYLSNPDKNTSFGFELKGLKASNLEFEQLNRYKNIPIRQYLTLGGAFYRDVESHLLQTIIGVNNSRQKYVKEFIASNEFSFPIVSIDQEAESIQVVHETIIDSKVSTKLSKIVFDSFDVPTYIYYDKETKPHQIAPRIINKIFQLAKIDYQEFAVDEIVEETYCAIPELHKIIGFDVKKSVIEKIKKILRDMSENEFNSFLNWDSQIKKWKIRRLSSKSHLNTDTAFLQLGKQYVNRLRQNISAGNNNHEQLSLFAVDEIFEGVF